MAAVLVLLMKGLGSKPVGHVYMVAVLVLLLIK